MNEVIQKEIELYNRDDKINGFVAFPSKTKSLSAVVLIHEVFGLNEHFRELTIRLATQGFLVLVLDLYSRDNERIKLFGTREELLSFLDSLDYNQICSDIECGITFLANHEVSNGKVSLIGFCMGGSIALKMGIENKSVQTTTVFYGRVVKPVSKVKDLNCPLIAFYGELDPLYQDVPGFVENLQKYNKAHEVYSYANTDHGFFNDTRDNYDYYAANDSWEKLISFLQKYS